MPNAILDPTGTVTTSSARPAAARAPRRASLNGARVGLLINTKTNARPFLEEVGGLLTERYGVTVTRRTKTNFAVPEPDDIIKELAQESDVVVTGVGDCGSCSAATAAADGVMLEAAGGAGRGDRHRLVPRHRGRDGRAPQHPRLPVRGHRAPGRGPRARTRSRRAPPRCSTTWWRC